LRGGPQPGVSDSFGGVLAFLRIPVGDGWRDRETPRRRGARQTRNVVIRFRDRAGEVRASRGATSASGAQEKESMVLKLGKLNRGPHLPALVASSISREIAQGRLMPGDQLPSEQALATTFGVSRNVVREAIAKLRSEGRVWSKQGRGAFVGDNSNAFVLAIDQVALRESGAFIHLFELRGILEVEAAALAAARRSPADLARMQSPLEAMASAPYGSVQWLKADLEFHHAVAQATDNPYMTQFLGFVSEQIRESVLAVGGRGQDSDNMATVTLAEHSAILAAIERGDAVAAHTAMRLHLVNASQRLGLSAEERDSPKTAVRRRRTEKAALPQLGE
jgi:GntR family transcriptional regulator, transcriptional repressor for pyruvate dehydrogenase complex